ncbi:MAG: 50S ribosomal protein L19 [Pelagibacteraceae bacterium]|jgi:large subunit ribosomal protein L19|nr:50S ribosomal protein L19 [Pelagibacteraceae bacterium]MBO6469159.1 50S ribosomal protein L19 [Pelagibacteraceae bacterium]MBO6469756.1 50S ribosomal protein L19 [Pelagibacteraceae bacterium]MBO6471746.1 50S ribosomal protein L19 [Pelagibacteraceae bacterium]MBO6479932.1 50S ribosomal protein L19 [Pelagibacteraceae bacterium]|tara:strand:- start:475 stop:1095 length:621 start_codon:yes stop_codon:yes gene_type:complete
MNNLVEKFEKKQIIKLTSKKNIPTFRPGDTLRVTIKIAEGERSRLQASEGMCIARKNNSINSKFTVRKVSHGEGVERVFPLFSPMIDKIEVVKKGDVKRAKLYYLRKRTGKSSRIADRDRGEEADQYVMTGSQNPLSDKIQKNDEVSEESENIKDEQTASEEENLTKEELSNQPVSEPVAEEKKPTEKKSESTASEEEKTEDETKS